jgi:hypothetical protein
MRQRQRRRGGSIPANGRPELATTTTTTPTGLEADDLSHAPLDYSSWPRVLLGSGAARSMRPLAPNWRIGRSPPIYSPPLCSRAQTTSDAASSCRSNCAAATLRHALLRSRRPLAAVATCAPAARQFRGLAGHTSTWQRRSPLSQIESLTSFASTQNAAPGRTVAALSPALCKTGRPPPGYSRITNRYTHTAVCIAAGFHFGAHRPAHVAGVHRRASSGAESHRGPLEGPRGASARGKTRPVPAA